MHAPVLVTPPAEQPVSLAEAKAHLRVTSNDDDVLIGSLIKAATAKLDGYSGILGRALVTQTWAVDLDRFGDRLRLPLRPVQSVATVQYYDTAGVQQTLAGAGYALLADAIGSYVALAPNAVWPGTYGRSDAVRVTFVAGYGNAAAVPEPIRVAILLAVQHLYALRNSENVFLRSEQVEGVGATQYAVSEQAGSIITRAVDALVEPYRVRHI
jgi:uncharacterized phiE125 gp8 family phage protein